MTQTLNRNVGIVDEVIGGGQKIVVKAQFGGRFTCRNRGFEVGDVICYLVDPLTQSVTNLMLKEVADAKVLLGENPDLHLAIQEDCDDETVHDPTGEGSETEIDPDCRSPEDRVLDTVGAGYCDNPLDLYDPTGFDCPDHMGAEEPGEADSLSFYLPAEFASLQGLVCGEQDDY